MKVFVSTLLLLPFMIFCQDKVDVKENNKLPNDVRWVVKSSEYKILSNQIYENAWDNLSKIFGLADSKSCIVMDLCLKLSNK